ncbi:uncharacterized protein RSE6_11379 [Rhynchosporium secalis]|uniref:BTB domain-containing protein n=1 Tax=Rhynchosporium secalis TaxID=38038 RepID=A0A1E1MMU7_RHYSE|nr:uncharacterized protein RSE6_11379 [Rhynchosporium secalis]
MAFRAKNSRAQDHTYYRDMKVVLEPLTELNHRLNRFSPTVWATIGDVKVFQSRTVFNDEYGHQRETMAAVAKEKPMQSLSELISRAYIPICWSQVPCAIHEPSSHVFNQMSKKGKPHVSLVWKHLQTLKFISLQLKPYHVKDYLGDLRKTYQHLQDHLEESTGTFILNDNELWLNMSEWNHLTVLMEDLRSSLQSLDKLVLSSSVDSGSVQAVRPGLMVELLRGLGCMAIMYPTMEKLPEVEGFSLVAALRQLRKDRKLLDVTYSSEGRTIEAHTVVLASISMYCRIHYANWTRPPVISFDRTVDKDFFLTFRTLEILIDYAYEEPIDWKKMQVLETDDHFEIAHKRDMLLNICKGADYWRIPSLLALAEHQLLHAGKQMINLDNVYELKRIAEDSRASLFLKLCQDFIDGNLDAVVRAHSQQSG